MKRIKYLIAGVCALLATASYAQQLHFSGTLQNTCTCGAAFRSPTAVYWQPI